MWHVSACKLHDHLMTSDVNDLVQKRLGKFVVRRLKHHHTTVKLLSVTNFGFMPRFKPM